MGYIEVMFAPLLICRVKIAVGYDLQEIQDPAEDIRV